MFQLVGKLDHHTCPCVNRYGTYKLVQKMPGGEKMTGFTRILHRVNADECMDEVWIEGVDDEEIQGPGGIVTFPSLGLESTSYAPLGLHQINLLMRSSPPPDPDIPRQALAPRVRQVV